MKKLFSLICLLALAAGTAFAQKMVVRTDDGKVVKYKVSQVECVMFEEDFVDLGLPSGTLWAKYNLGAESPEQFGYFYAWGETKTKSDYSWSTYKLCEGSSSTLTKYNATDGLTELKPADDAAMVRLGIEWQMPSLEQIEELVNSDYTTSEWTQENGVNGTKITSKLNGESIFLPAAGIQNDTRLISKGEIGQYWSRTLYGVSSPANAYALYIRSSGSYWSILSREGGKSIRPVVCVDPPQPVLVEQIVLSPPILTLELNDYQNLAATVLPEDASNKTLEWESSNAFIATVSGNGRVTAVAEGSCTITCRATDGSGVYAECQVSVIAYDGKGYVNLGLPSGTLWAMTNIGASSPEEYGDFFAWGETEPKSDYSWETYKWCEGSENKLTKYCTRSNYGYQNFTDDLTELEPEDDAATANWGNGWQMPSLEQMQELFNDSYTTHECTTVTVDYEMINGIKVTSKINGNSIFLPAAGCRDDTSLINAGLGGYYWSRSLLTYHSNYAYYLRFGSAYFDWYYDPRPYGRSIRPVRKK